MTYSDKLIRRWNAAQSDEDKQIVHGFPTVIHGIVSSSGAGMFNVEPDTEVSLVYDVGCWWLLSTPFSRSDIINAVYDKKFFSDSIIAACLIKELEGWSKIDEWDAQAASRLYGICKIYGTSETFCVLTACRVYSSKNILSKGITSISCSFTLEQPNTDLVDWAHKIITWNVCNNR